MQHIIFMTLFSLSVAAAPHVLFARDVTCGSQDASQGQVSQPSCCDVKTGLCSLLELFNTCHANKMYCCDFSNNVSLTVLFCLEYYCFSFFFLAPELSFVLGN